MCAFFIYYSCSLCFPVSARQNKKKIDARIVYPSLLNGVIMNGRHCKSKVTEACYKEPWGYASVSLSLFLQLL